MKILLSTFLILSANLSFASDMLECWVPGITHSPRFYVSDEKTLSATSGGTYLQVPKASVVNIKRGNKIIETTAKFEDEETYVEKSEIALFKIKETTGSIALVLESTGEDTFEGTISGLKIGKIPESARDWSSDILCNGSLK